MLALVLGSARSARVGNSEDPPIVDRYRAITRETTMNEASKDHDRARTHEKTPKEYRDRPANEGKHGDAAEEPNSGPPDLPRDSPGRPKSESSRQQRSHNQVTQTGSGELDSQSAAGSQRPKR